MMLKYFFAALMMSSLILSPKVLAVPLAEITGPAEPGYYKLILNRFMDWYESKNKPLRNQLSAAEKKYVQYALDHVTAWSYQMAPHTQWNYLRVTAGQAKGIMHTQRLAVAPTLWNPESLKMLQSILSQRNIKIPEREKLENLLWPEWDLDRNEFSLYFKTELDPKQVPQSELYYPNSLKQYVYSKGRLTQEKVYVSRKEVPEDIKAKYIFYPMISDVVDILVAGKIQNQIFEVKSFDDRFIDDPLKTFANAARDEFRLLADSMIYVDHSNIEIFYP